MLDPGAGLTQVLADGTNTYLYGNDRLAQYQAAMQYFGADGLGSVRQIIDASAMVVGSSRYDPFGNVMAQSGTATSVFAFAGEQQDATGLEYLRARYYSWAQGRFTTRDVWQGDPNAPMSYNAWLYAYANAVNLVDPTGYQAQIYGVSISSKFSRVEEGLIVETIRAYANLLGGEVPFRLNVLLRRVEQDWILRSTRDNAAHDPASHTIILPPNLLTDVLDVNPNPDQGGFVIRSRFNIYGQDFFPTVPKSTFPNQETVFKFVLGHETTHALVTGNEKVYQSFIDTFFPKQSACFPGSLLVDVFDLRGSPPSDPSIERNKGRATFREEVLADAIAGYLFAPTLLGNKYAGWIENDLRRQLR